MEPVYVELKLKPGIALEGRVLDGRGAAMSDTKLDIISYTRETVSGDNMAGYRLELASHGSKEDDVSDDSLGWIFTDENGHFQLSFKKDWDLVTIHMNSPIHGLHTFSGIPLDVDQFIELRLPKLTALHGRIISNRGTPVIGYKIMLNGIWVQHTPSGGSIISEGESYETVLDLQGKYNFDSIEPNQEYTISILSTDGTTVVQNISLQEEVEVKNGEANEWNYRIEEAIVLQGKVTGEVTGKPLSGIKVSCGKEEVRGQGTWAMTDQSGRYELHVFTGAGEYEVSPSYIYMERGGSLAGKGCEKNIELTYDNVHELDLILPELVKRSFLVVDGAGQPVSGARASVRERTDNMSTGSKSLLTTNEDGYLVADSLSPRAETWLTFIHDDYLNADSEEHIGEPGEIVPEEIIVMYRKSGLTAKLVDTEGNPLADVEAEFRMKNGVGFEEETSARTNKNGVVELLNNVPATILSVQVVVESEEENSDPLTYTANSVECEPELVTDLGEIVMAMGDSSL